MNLGKFFKNIFKGATKVVKTIVPVLPFLGIVSPTLFGLTKQKGLVGTIAKGIIGLTRSKGKIDPKKVVATLWAMSAIQSAGQQRRALDQIRAEQQFVDQFVIPQLKGTQALTNQLMGTLAGQIYTPPQYTQPPVWWFPYS